MPVTEALESVLHECPYCHRVEAAQVISKTPVDSSMLQPQDLPDRNRGVFIATRQRNLEPMEVDPKSATEVTAYKVDYRCKHCGREWSRTVTEDVKIPEEYAEYEDEDRDEAESANEEELVEEE